MLFAAAEDRIVFIGMPVDDHNREFGHRASALFTKWRTPRRTSHLHQLPGGSVTAGLAVYDTMQFLTCDVTTYLSGMAASMRAVLLCAGRKANVFALPNSDIMILRSQVALKARRATSSGRSITCSAQKALDQNHRPAHRQSGEQVRLDSDRDYYMSAAEAKAYGLVDEVIKSRRTSNRLLEQSHFGSRGGFFIAPS